MESAEAGRVVGVGVVAVPAAGGVSVEDVPLWAVEPFPFFVWLRDPVAEAVDVRQLKGG